MSSGWLRLAGRAGLGLAVGLALDATALWFLRSGYYLFPLGHVAIPLLPLLLWLRSGWHVTLLVVGPFWALSYAILPALAYRPKWVLLFLVLGCHVHALLLPLSLFRRYTDPVIYAALLAYCASLFGALGGLYWLCRDPAAEE